MTPKRKLEIHPCGETHPWKFETGHWCGEARDSVGISRGGLGCVLKREDVRALRKFLEQAEAEWDINPPTYAEIEMLFKNLTKKGNENAE